MASLSDLPTRGEKRKITNLGRFLREWFKDNRRHFPWRERGTGTYERICVEVLLQRTRAQTVANIYGEFFGRFPDWEEIAQTDELELGEFLKPLGLWRRRATGLKKLAIYAADRDGVFPDIEMELADVPAVGQYVANAILLFQHGQRKPLLDVNMARLLERYVRPRRLADIRHDPWLQAASAWLIREEDPIDTNWAALDFAAHSCLPTKPRCPSCHLHSNCIYHSGS
jgi:A/G-specific adenine glycosylase